MEKESLCIALGLIIDSLSSSSIDSVDKVELMINLRHFLCNYDEAIKQKVGIKVKEPYTWNYNIKIKTAEGTYEQEEPDLTHIDDIIGKHPSYEELRVQHVKRLIKQPTRGANENRVKGKE